MLKGKNAIITGARTGIGLATLRLFASNHCNCWAVVHSQDEAFMDEIVSLTKEYGVLITPVHIDMSSSESIKKGFKAILSENKAIDILVNAAGVVSPSRLFSMTPMDEIRRVMEVNFFSVLELSQLVSRAMMRNRKGSIINISSIAAWCEDTSQLEYSCSKAALACATKKMANELAASGIRVNSVAPGLTNTKMLSELNDAVIEDIKKALPMHRLGTPEEVAEVCLFLASDKSSYINGATIKVDGGGFDNRLVFG